MNLEESKMTKLSATLTVLWIIFGVATVLTALFAIGTLAIPYLIKLLLLFCIVWYIIGLLIKRS